jgi:DNA-binding SARP family transcriptional activator
VPVSVLSEALWGPDETADRRHSLQQHVSSLRKVISEAGVADQVVITADGPGYRMSVARTAIDAFAFEALRRAARVSLGEGDPSGAATLLTEGLGLWRGDALVDFLDQPWFSTRARAFSEDRLVATEELVDVRLSLGHHRELVGELESLVAAEPFRERLWAQLMLSLYRSERQADALATFARARSILVEELGIEPGESLRSLESRILAQDPALFTPGTPEGVGPSADTAVVNGDRGVYIELPDGQQVHLGTAPVVLGREPSCTARLNDSRVSRRHAVVEADGSRFVLRDLESTNGTFVNGNRIVEATLDHGDLLSLGGVDVVFHHQ